LKRVPSLAELPEPPDFGGPTRIDVEPQAHLTIGAIQVPTGIPREKRAVPYALLAFDYAGHLLEHPAHGSEELRYVDGRLLSIHRSRSAEFAAVEVLLRRGLKQVAEAQHVPWQMQERLPDAAWILDQHRPSDTQIDTFLALKPLLAAEGIAVRYDPSFPVELVAPPEDVIGEIAADGNQWFSLSLGIDVDGRRIELLPVLASALASRRFPLEPAPNEPDDAVWMAPLDERRRVPLPVKRVRELIAPLVELLTGIDPNATRVRVPRLRALALTRESEAVRWHGDGSVRRLLAALDDETDHSDIAPPGLAATLRPYQSDGVRWLDRLGRAGLGGVLADDMGLGKTLQLIAYLLLRRARGDLAEPALVVSPTSVVPNWQAELARFAPGLRVLALRGTRRKADFTRIGDHDVVLSSYALLPRDGEVLAERRWSVVVLDEAQWVKNPRTQAAQVARSLDARHRLCLTGTPLENHLGELWAQFDFALPGLLGDEREFSRWYRTPIEKHRDLTKAERLARRISPFIKRRTKAEVALDLPPKTVMVRTVELEGRQRELYESLRVAMHERVHEALARRGMAQSHIVVLDALLKLRQACCDPRLVRLDAAAGVQESAKLDELVAMLEELVAEDRHTLVFSQFASMLELIAASLDAAGITYEMLRGDTQDRETPVARFQRGEVKVFLISLKAGGVGLNLTAADTVIHYDPWWNPAAEEQATDRAHRIGQDKPVFVYKLIAAGTVEEKIQALQAKKAELASAILDEAVAAPELLSESDIAALFD
jgi:superfamily II DNA or RNA helicase